jgi:tetratricopeptide (TPR) repeat protein
MHYRDLIQSGQEGVDSQIQCWGLYGQGFTQRHVGQLDEAVAALQASLELAKTIPDHAFRIMAAADLARCYLQQGALAHTLVAFQESEEFYVANLGGDTYASLRNGLAEAYLLAAEQSDSTERADWLRKAGRGCQAALKQGKAFRGGLPEAMRLQGTYELLRGNPAIARKWWQRSLTLAEKMGQRYDLGMAYLEIGRRLGDREHLERAEAIFREIGAEWDLKRTQQALEKL